jgi:hypothetical protein
MDKARHAPKKTDDFRLRIKGFGNEYKELLESLRKIDP